MGRGTGAAVPTARAGGRPWSPGSRRVGRPRPRVGCTANPRGEEARTPRPSPGPRHAGTAALLETTRATGTPGRGRARPSPPGAGGRPTSSSPGPGTRSSSTRSSARPGRSTPSRRWVPTSSYSAGPTSRGGTSAWSTNGDLCWSVACGGGRTTRTSTTGRTATARRP